MMGQRLGRVSRVMGRFSERSANRGDEKSLGQAERECFSDPWPEHFFSTEIEAPQRYCRVLVDAGGQLVAYLFCAWRSLDLHVLKVATRPGFRRQGLACLLMENAEAYVIREGGETVMLEVRRSNVEAQELYTTMGYSVVGTRFGYYADGEDGLVMTKRFLGMCALS
jgi:ribosomal-protein-alanine N-acetyltransferase